MFWPGFFRVEKYDESYCIIEIMLRVMCGRKLNSFSVPLELFGFYFNKLRIDLGAFTL